jgi:hypothetical protein
LGLAEFSVSASGIALSFMSIFHASFDVVPNAYGSSFGISIWT